MRQEAHQTTEHKSSLLERVGRPNNAGALSTIQKIHELLAVQGRRPDMEFHQADIDHSGVVSGKISQKQAGGGRRGR